MDRSALCRACRQPFVASENVATVLGTKEIRHRLCIECRANMGAQAEIEMDCVDYLEAGGEASSLWRRLRDGSELLRE